MTDQQPINPLAQMRDIYRARQKARRFTSTTAPTGPDPLRQAFFGKPADATTETNPKDAE